MLWSRVEQETAAATTKICEAEQQMEFLWDGNAMKADR